jgi:hypothetical protein
MTEQEIQPEATSEINPAPQAGGGDDLDSLLADYDAGTRESLDRSAANAPIGSLDELFDERHTKLREQAAYSSQIADEAKQQVEALTRLQQEMANQEYRKKHEADLSDLVRTVRGSVDSDRFPDEIVQAWIDAQAQKNAEWQSAWLQRAENPRQWQQVEAKLCRAFASSAMAVIDPALTEDRAIVAAAVRGASRNGVPEAPPPNFGRMSDRELRQYTLDNFGYDSTR